MTAPEGERRARFALVGCGSMGAFVEEKARSWEASPHYLPMSFAAAIRAARRAALVALCDVNSAALEAADRLHGPVARYSDAAAMLERERPEAVAIATRTPGRAALIEACIDAGVRGIYSEKPLCSSLEEADRLRQRIEGEGVSFFYGTRRRYMGIYREARRLSESGELGPLETVTIKMKGVGLLWTHPHSADLALFFAGEAPVEYVQADLDIDPATVEGKVVDADPNLRSAFVRFANGVGAHFVPEGSVDVELGHARGRITVKDNGISLERRGASPAFTDGRFTRVEVERMTDAPSATVACVEALAAAVLDGKPASEGIDFAVRSQEILFGFVLSHLQGGRRVHGRPPREGWILRGRTGDRFA